MGQGGREQDPLPPLNSPLHVSNERISTEVEFGVEMVVVNFGVVVLDCVGFRDEKKLSGKNIPMIIMSLIQNDGVNCDYVLTKNYVTTARLFLNLF